MGLLLLLGTTEAKDIPRSNASAATAAASGGAASSNGTPAAAALPSTQERLARTTQALTAVRQMQEAARKLAIAGPNNLRPDLPAVPVNSYGQPNGLVLATGDIAALWTGANLPETSSKTEGATTTTTISITQTQQQAILNWKSFNIGKNTTLSFDQSAGGADAGQWIAFNFVRDPTGAPSQILGQMKTVGAPDAQGHAQVGGQIYVMNANGIIFGGSSQVNTHSLVASSLPINYNLIQRGLLNNPDAQFQFSAVPQLAGSKGPTAGFDPSLASSDNSVPVQLPHLADGSESATGRYGDVIVQPGAILKAETNADHVGGRIALVGPNVTNAGTISTEDGQAILAAGLQVGFAAHNGADPTLRGLDVFVGKVADAALPNQTLAGTATNAGLDATNLGVSPVGFNTATTNPAGLNVLGLIEAPRGSIYITGRTIDQSGVLASSTSVSYNGRVDLVAGFNAVPNPKFDPSLEATADFTVGLPFFFQSYIDNLLSGLPVVNSGLVTLGRGSVLQIMPEIDSTERTVGNLALPSQINLQGQSVHFLANSTLLAPGAKVPSPTLEGDDTTGFHVVVKKAFGADGAALEAGITIRAGAWFNPGSTLYRFVQTQEAQQIYLDTGAVIDAAGMAGVSAAVAENVVSVELRGSEFADFPLQRDGVLRGETVLVDVRKHGAWDPTLNGGFGGYAWVGTPLANTSGWVGLTTHTVGELTTNGGSVALKAGGAVVLQQGATVDVSGGSIDYQGGYTRTAKVMSEGHIYDISQATPDRKYDGLYTGTNKTTDPKWGVSETTFNALSQGVYENGYLQGGAGGSLSVTSAVLALDGTLRGRTVAGNLQRTLSPVYKPGSPPDPANPQALAVPDWLAGSLHLPMPSQLSLTLKRQYFPTVGGSDYSDYSPTPANIFFRSSSTAERAEDFRLAGDYLFPIQRNYEINLSPSLVNQSSGSGFGVLRVNNRDDDRGNSSGYGNITITQGTLLELPAGGSLSLSAANISVEADPGTTKNTGIKAPGGWIGLTAFDVSPSSAQVVANTITSKPILTYDSARGSVSVGAGATLDTAGALVDDRPGFRTTNLTPLIIDGGQISINGGNVAMKPGSVLDVSGGGVFTGPGKLAYGDAGTLSLNAGQNSGELLGQGFGAVLGGRLEITGATFQGYAGLGKKGGELNLQAPAVSVLDLKGPLVATNTTTGAFALDPEFFNLGGFSKFSVSGLGITENADGGMTGAAPAFVVAPQTVLVPQVKNWVASPGGAVLTAREGERRPVSLIFKASGPLKNVNDIDLGNNTAMLLGANAAVVTDPGGSVALSGGTVDVLGRITAKGGKITLTQSGDGKTLYVPNVHLGAAAVLDASGATVFTSDLNGYHKSDVLDGGLIAVAGNIAAEKGAVLDVSGASDAVEWIPGKLTTSLPGSSGLFPLVKDSNGGTLTLTGDQVLFTAATLRGSAGGATARGGDLNIVSNRSRFDLTAQKNGAILPGQDDTVLTLSPSSPKFVYTGFGEAVTDSNGKRFGDEFALGLTWFGASSFTDGGFGGLNLTVGRGAIQVQGNVSLSASRQITIADGGVLSFASATSGGSVTPKPELHLTAPYVVLGQPFQAPQESFGLSAVPSYGDGGTLSVKASSLIDVGNLVLQGVGTATLDATNGGITNGAIRGNGTLDVAGALVLKASQIYPPTAVDFNIVAFDYSPIGSAGASPGSVTILSSNDTVLPQLPLSAAGSLNIYASIIDQGGVLRAPLGQINLGRQAATKLDPVSGLSLPATKTLTLQPGSVTSVSAIDPVTGKALTIPYGIDINGDNWVAPSGVDITSVGPTAKAITLTADGIDFAAGASARAAAVIDLSGGGDLFAYQFVPGTGGTKDILLGETAGAFAILPTGDAPYAPFAPYGTSTDANGFKGDSGYTIRNPKLNYMAGDRIHLEGGGGLPAGDYTLLPARYAVLPGAYLVTPRSVVTTAGAAKSVVQPDGSVVMAGYRFNGFDPAGMQSLFRSFEVAAQAVVTKRAQYDLFFANTFFADLAAKNETVTPRLPLDSGRLLLSAASSLHLQGDVRTRAPAGGRGGLIDISSIADILIGSRSVIAGLGTTSGQLLLDAEELSNFASDSLLIGGVRTSGVDGTNVNVTTNKLTVDNAGEALTGSEIILVANKTLTLAANAEIQQTRTLSSPAEKLLVSDSIQLNKTAGNDVITVSRGGTPITFPNGLPAGDKITPSSSYSITLSDGTTTVFAAGKEITSLTPGSTVTLSSAGKLTASFNLAGEPIVVTLGDGVLVRVSSDPTAQIARSGVASSITPALTVGAGAKISGASITLDSTNATSFDGSTQLNGESIALHSGQISLLLDPKDAGSPPVTSGLVLSTTALQTLQAGAKSLSLLSYSSIDLYGSGTLGTLDGTGKPKLENLALHAGEIRGFSASGGGGNATLVAQNILLDNSPNVAAPGAVFTPTSVLTFDAGEGTIELGANQLNIDQYEGVTLKASGGILVQDTGSLLAQKNLTLATSLLTAATSATQAITATGDLKIVAQGSAPTVSTGGLGAQLTLTGATVAIDSAITLHSGTVTARATTGDVQIGNVSPSRIDVSGTKQNFFEVAKYTDGGRITLSADAGNMTIAAGSKVSVAADIGGGSAGTLTVSVPQGNFSIAGHTLFGQAGAAGQGGTFSLDTLGIPGADPTASHLAVLSETLTDGGFARQVALRVREGNVVADGTIRAHDYALSADHGSITVTGTIDASGLVGSTRSNPLGGVKDAADPTGGKIELTASGSVVLAPSAWLTAAGYSYSNAGKGGAISLSAGSYVYRGGTGQINPTGVIDVQAGARFDLGVKSAFTPNDLLLNPGLDLPVSTRTDFFTGTLHLREPQTAFGTGAQFAGVGSSVNGASGIVLEGFQVFDLTGTNGSISTTGAITKIGSGGLIDSAVQKAVKDNGTSFIGGVSTALLGNTLVHVQPGAEIVNHAVVGPTVTRNFVTLNSNLVVSGSDTRSVVNFNLKPGNGVFTTAFIPGGLPMGVTLTTTAGRRFTLTTADGTTSGEIIATANIPIASTSATNPIVAINFKNTGATALSTALNFVANSTPVAPVTFAFDPSTTATPNSFASGYASLSGDITLANTWDLSTYRFGPRLEPGNLTLRAKGNLVFGFDASLSDGFDPTNPVEVKMPLATAQLMTNPSWSYRLVAGADYGAADSRSVQPLGALVGNSGSVLVGQGAFPLLTTPAAALTRDSLIPRFFQTIRTGTGDIDVAAGRDVQFLNPLATIYTAGRRADSLSGFDVPVLNSRTDQITAQLPYYSAQYSLAGGDVNVWAQNDIARYVKNGTSLKPDSNKEVPTNWLYRRGNLGSDGNFAALAGAPSSEIQSTSWWIDFSNFFSDIGALGGGNVSLMAGRDVSNVNASVPTNARMPGKNGSGQPIAPDVAKLVELGGGDIAVRAGRDIDAGVYYVERGDATLRAGGGVHSNSSRAAFGVGANSDPVRWLPTTFFLGKGTVDVAAAGDIRMGPVVNPFWLPQGLNNRYYESSYFSTFAPVDKVSVSSLGGSVTLQGRPDTANASSAGSAAWLLAWYANILSDDKTALGLSQPWLRLTARDLSTLLQFRTGATVQPATFWATAFAGDINLTGSLALAPSPTGSIDLLAAENINGFGINGVSGTGASTLSVWGSAAINLSDADPSRLPGITSPISSPIYNKTTISPTLLNPVNALFAESGSTDLSLEQKLALHGQIRDEYGQLGPLHANDPELVHIYAAGGDLSGLTLYSAKSARVLATADLTDIAFYVQNARAGDITLVAAGRDIVAYDPVSRLRVAAQKPGNLLPGAVGDTGPAGGTPTTGDIQIAGPGTLEVLAGRNLTLGGGNNPKKDGTAAGITSVGSVRNSVLPQNSGADIIALAGAKDIYTPAAAAIAQTPGLASTSLQFSDFIAKFLDPEKAGAQSRRYLPVLGSLMGMVGADAVKIWEKFGYKVGVPLSERQAALVLGIFNRVLRDAGRDRNDKASPNFGTYQDGFSAIEALFPGSPLPDTKLLASGSPGPRPASPWTGTLSMATREIKTFEGSNISLLAPGGGITVGRPTDPQKADQGILTERGGNISIYATDSVNVGTSRIFTLRGGDEIVWSTWGNIAAGSGSKTVFTAPPTRVLIDPQSADVKNDLAGLATGSGIGVLATLAGVKPGNVDLIAPSGAIDAGDAGIRSSGNLNLAARVVLNAGNIQVGGSTAGAPPPPAAPNLGAITTASNTSAAATSSANEIAKRSGASAQATEFPSIITVEVLGYGGDDESDDENDRKKSTNAGSTP